MQFLIDLNGAGQQGALLIGPFSIDLIDVHSFWISGVIV